MDGPHAHRPARSLVILVVLLTVLAAACTSGVDTSADGGEQASGGTEAAGGGGGEGEGDADTISLWYLQDHEVMVTAAIERFNEEYPDITVDAQGVENDPYKTRLQTAMGTAAAPDVFHSWGGGWLQQFVDAGRVLALDDYLAEHSDWSELLSKPALEVSTFDGSVYAVPAILGGVYMWYRTDVFEENGVEPPETYDELLEVIQTLNDNGVTPITLANASSWTGSFYYMYLAQRLAGEQAFLDAYNRAGDGSFASEPFVEAGARIQELVDAGAFIDGFNGLNYDTGESNAPLWSGDAAMQLMGDWLLNAARTDVPDVADQIDFFPFPAIESPDGTGESTSMVGGVNGAFSVTADAANPEAAMALARYLTDTDSAQSVVDEALGTPAIEEGVQIDDPYMQRFVEALSTTDYLQPYYDQYLPPELAAVHLETTQAVFGKTMTPEEAAQQVESVAAEVLSGGGATSEPAGAGASEPAAASE
jgi:raffinose/stachyose/melibiose transport system substrate-binding protein